MGGMIQECLLFLVYVEEGIPLLLFVNFCDTIGVFLNENIIDISLLDFCLRKIWIKKAPRVMAVLDPAKLVITNYPEDKVEWRWK